MDDKLRTLLDKIYELEGLVYLAIQRRQEAGNFLKLIEKKGQEVARDCSGLNSDKDEVKELPVGEDTVSSLTFPLEEYSIDDYSIAVDEDLKEEENITKTADKTIKVDKVSVETAPQKGKLVFSINERFRFKKELFNNSDADFNNTMALVASMEDYDEAEDFFLNEEGFDKGNPVVGEFLDIIKGYFK